PIEPLAVVPLSALKGFQADLTKVGRLAADLSTVAQPFVGATAPVGGLAFDVVERCKSLTDAAEDPGPDPDPFDTLYVLNRVAVGIGKLVPPQIEGAAISADQLADAMLQSHPAESGRIRKLAVDLRAAQNSLRPRIDAVSVPAGTRWARSQNQYF